MKNRDITYNRCCSRRSSELAFRRCALGCIPAHSFAAAVGEVDHVSGGGGVVADLGSFVAGLTSADGIDEVRDMNDGGVRLGGKVEILGVGLLPALAILCGGFLPP